MSFIDYLNGQSASADYWKKYHKLKRAEEKLKSNYTMSDSNEFWNDKNVLDFVSKTIHDRLEWALLHDASAAPQPIQLALNEFKASKQPFIKEWEIISGQLMDGAYTDI